MFINLSILVMVAYLFNFWVVSQYHLGANNYLPAFFFFFLIDATGHIIPLISEQNALLEAARLSGSKMNRNDPVLGLGLL